MSEFKLSASLEGHEDDVRGVSFPDPKSVISASRDATVRVWSQVSENPPKYDSSIASHGQAFINTVAFLPPSSEHQRGLIVAGGKDTIIEVREPGKPPDANAERLLVGHAHNVCSLDVSPDGTWIVSGSWDATARVWSVGKWETIAVLENHEASVWSVLAYDKDTVITACADKLIRVFTPNGKLLRTIRGSSDVVRALCKLPQGHPSGADFASAGNDSIIRLWSIEGRQIAELYGHENFIYCIANLSNGELISSSEDRTVRVWRGNECVQTITHPAISVWTVAACSENGDIVSGASDRILRVFTRAAERQADPQTIETFEESVKRSSIPQQQVGEINKEKLPGPEFLTQKSGTREGQVVMIREANGSVTAHTWSTATNQWVNVGTVVDAVGSSGKKTDYLGKDYDYVFDVDIEDGKPPLKLPYNLSQNPYEAATKFIQDNELPITYLDQVANFITTNTQGATLGQSSQSNQAPAGADPWGSESRYRPGESSQPSSQPPPAAERPKVLPQIQYLSIKTANLKTIQKKIEELNDQLLSSGAKDGTLSSGQISILRNLTSALEKTSLPLPASDPSAQEGIEILTHLLTAWSPTSRLPILDLLRLLTAGSPAPATYRTGTSASLIEILAQSGVISDMERPNNVMLGVRALANLFETEAGQQLADEKFAEIHELVKPLCKGGGGSNRNLTIAVSTLYINYAVLSTSATHRNLPSSMDRAFVLLEDLAGLLGAEKDSEAVYRALVAVGTLLVLGEEVRDAARLYGTEEAVRKAGKRNKEPRIKAVIKEIEDLLAA